MVTPSKLGFSSLMNFQNAFSAKVLDANLISDCDSEIRQTYLGTCLPLGLLGLSPRIPENCTRSSLSR